MARPSSIKTKDLSVHLTVGSKIDQKDLRKRLLRDGWLQERCYKCNLPPVWNKKNLSLQLEHKNGVSDDNRIENLEMLCPNCHTQTKTWGSKRFKILNKCIDCGLDIHKKSKRCIQCHGTSRRS